MCANEEVNGRWGTLSVPHCDQWKFSPTKWRESVVARPPTSDEPCVVSKPQIGQRNVHEYNQSAANVFGQRRSPPRDLAARSRRIGCRSVAPSGIVLHLAQGNEVDRSGVELCDTRMMQIGCRILAANSFNETIVFVYLSGQVVSKTLTKLHALVRVSAQYDHGSLLDFAVFMMYELHTLGYVVLRWQTYLFITGKKCSPRRSDSFGCSISESHS